MPGVVISRYNPVGSYGGGDGGAVFVRGQGAGRPGAEIATLVDGVPKFVGVWTHPLLDTLSVDLADQIDVYKGAQPVLFGNMSFAAIDLVPRRETERASAAAPARRTGASTLGTSRGQASGKQGRFDLLVTGEPAPERRAPGNADGRTRALFGRAGFDLAPAWASRSPVTGRRAGAATRASRARRARP